MASEKQLEHYQRQARLAEIVKRAAAIIPGPWEWYGNTATDEVFLATRDRGRLFILTTDTRTEQYVFDHLATEGYDIEDARRRVHELWCPTHAEHVDPVDPGRCMCDALREFLSGELEPVEGHRDFNHEDRGYRISLSRHVQVHPDLRFPVPFAGHGMEAEDHYKVHGGIMRSYREGMPRFEVLGYRTADQFNADVEKSAADAEARGEPLKLIAHAPEALYREDFMGLDNPNADFIANAAGDVAFLLAEVDRLQQATTQRLQGLNPKGSLSYECPECGAEVDIREADAL